MTPTAPDSTTAPQWATAPELTTAPEAGAASEPSTAPKPATVTELRLALVCYGGVSLAIYMHGVTKELHKLVAASRRFDELGPAAANPFDAATETEHAYFEALGDLARGNHLLSVNIDIVAGTSAGGINGVCLAKVLARNGSQEALKRLWIDEGDLTTLLHAPPIGGWRTRAVLAFGRVLAGLQRPISPLRGDRMSRLLYDAIAAMDHPVQPDRSTLLLPQTPLDLFVTTTDLDGLAVLVPSGTGGISQRETDHAQVVQLRSSGTDDDFGSGSTGALAFAARATSSFPGAFAPVSLDSFGTELGGRAYDPTSVEPLLRRRATGDGTGRSWFVDGGVLDNAPFDLVIEAIGRKRAQTEVTRRLVYIQPDPGVRLGTTEPGARSGGGAPGYLSALARSVGTVKGSHSILRELEDLRDLNLRIAELGSVAALQGEQVSRAIEQAWDAVEPTGPTSGLPQTSQTPQPSQTPQTSQTAQTSQTPQTPQTPQTLETPQTPQTPQTLQPSQTPQTPETSQTLQTLQTPETSKPPEAPAQAWSIEDPADVKRLADQLYAEAAHFVGAGFPTYCRLKVEAAGARLADEVVERFVYPPGSSRSSFVRAAISAWARGQVEWQQPDPTRLMELLGPVDVPYRERRLMFVLAGVNRLYGEVDTGPAAPKRASLDALKTQAWQLLEQLRAAPRLAMGAVTDSQLAFLGADLSDEAVFGNPEVFGAEHDGDFRTLFSTYRASLGTQLADSSLPLWDAFVRLTGEWTPTDQRSLLSRYLGFPLWDALIFPTVAFSALPQFTPITVSQFSPLTASALPTPDGGKLKGVSLHHFGGFIDAAWRENDYLWGRLDAAELILRMLGESRPGVRASTPTSRNEATDQAGPRLKGALAAILASETDLGRIVGLRQQLRADVDGLPS